MAVKVGSNDKEYEILEELGMYAIPNKIANFTVIDNCVNLGAGNPEIMEHGILQLLAYGQLKNKTKIIVFPRASENMLSLNPNITCDELCPLMCDWVIISSP